MGNCYYQFIMRGRARKLVYQSIPDLCAAIRQLSFESHRFQQSLTLILESACGIEQEKGLLELRIADYANSSPVEWAKEMDQLYTLIGFNSFLMGKIIDCANTQMTIEVNSLPKCVLDEFPKIGMYESRLIAGLRKEATGSFSIRLWDWFWITFIRSFMGLQLEEKRTFQEEYAEDEFFYNISRNFYLGLFHKALLYLSKDLKGRLVNLLHVYLIEELLFRFRKRDPLKGEIEIKYKLKSHYLYVLYLLILTNKDLEEETVKIYYQFLEKIADNYSSTTILTHNHNIRNMIRVWITLATRTVTVETVLLDKLKLANDQQGWFRLGRCPIDKFASSLDKLVIGSRELGRANVAKDGIIRLLDKFNEWFPSYSTLAAIEQLLVYEEKRMNIEYRKEREEEGGIIARAIERILTTLAEESTSREIIVPIHERLNKRVELLYARGVAFNYDSISRGRSSDSKAGSKSRLERRKLINHHYPRENNVWEYPLQHNEFLILYRMMYWVASQIDRVIPGRKEGQHPRTNLRILCNPLVFIVAVILVALLLRFA